MRITIGNAIRKLGCWVCGNYWRCSNCGHIAYKEQEVGCWQCSIGEMIYQG
jgi:hypothetical protein